jgi:hypothetical protein
VHERAAAFFADRGDQRLMLAEQGAAERERERMRQAEQRLAATE